MIFPPKCTKMSVFISIDNERLLLPSKWISMEMTNASCKRVFTFSRYIPFLISLQITFTYNDINQKIKTTLLKRHTTIRKKNAPFNYHHLLIGQVYSLGQATKTLANTIYYDSCRMPHLLTCPFIVISIGFESNRFSW